MKCNFNIIVNYRKFTGDPKVRVAVTNFFESIILCVETQNEFGPPVSEQYDHA